MNVSEEASENYERTNDTEFKYYSSKYSPAMKAPVEEPILPETLKKNASIYEGMSFDPDTNFYNNPINTTHSSVHVPTNTYDLCR